MATFAKYRRAVFDLLGNAIPGATVTVTDEATGLPATLFTTRTGTGKSNPFTSDAVTGVVEFYCAGGAYNIRIQKGTDYDETFRYEANGTFAEHDFDTLSEAFPVGSVGAPSIYFDGDATTGLYAPSVGTMAVTVGGVQKMLFAASLLSVAMAAVITSTAATAFAVGRQGSTDPVLAVDANTASVATGVKIIGAAAGARVNFAAISSGTNEGLSINGKGSGTVRLANVSTGAVEFSQNAVPTTTGDVDLGTTSLMWGNAFLKSGGVINWNAGNYTLTHSSGVLTFAASAAAIVISAGANNATIHPINSDASKDNVIIFSTTGFDIYTGIVRSGGAASGSYAIYNGGLWFEITSTGVTKFLGNVASTSYTTGTCVITGGLGLSGTFNQSVTSAGQGIFGVSTTIVKTVPHASDTTDCGWNLDYTISAASATNDTINRVVRLNITQNLTGGGVMSFLRCLDIATTTNAGTTTTYIDYISIIAAVSNGTVTEGAAMRVFSVQGTTKYLIYNYDTGAILSTACTVASTSTTTGSIVTAGGIGAAGAIFGGSTLNIAGVATVASGTATPAAGSTAARFLFGTTAGFGIYYGSGAPTVSAAQGSIYIRSDGSTIATRLYVNTNGSTTWTNFVSAA